jgi:hypothetical protein
MPYAKIQREFVPGPGSGPPGCATPLVNDPRYNADILPSALSATSKTPPAFPCKVSSEAPTLRVPKCTVPSKPALATIRPFADRAIPPTEPVC